MTITKTELKKLWSLMVDHDIKNKQQLANAVGAARSSVSLLMNGHHEFPRIRQRIADHFNVPYNSIWNSKKAA